MYSSRVLLYYLYLNLPWQRKVYIARVKGSPNIKTLPKAFRELSLVVPMSTCGISIRKQLVLVCFFIFPLFPFHFFFWRGKKKKEKEERKKGREEKKGKKKKQPTASHPSVKGQRPQERWIGAHWESQEANPFPSYRPFGFGPHYWLPVFWESIYVRSGPNPDSIIGEANVQNPSLQPNTPPRLPAKTGFKFNI